MISLYPYRFFVVVGRAGFCLLSLVVALLVAACGLLWLWCVGLVALRHGGS